jgi:chromobox protein 1
LGGKPKREEYIVEEIVDHRKTKGKDLYFVKWKDYSSEENTWEPMQNLTNCHNAFKKFFTSS